MLLSFAVALAGPDAPDLAPAEAPRFHYHGPAHDGVFRLDEIVGFIGEAPAAAHLVWQPGWKAWRNWNDVPEVARAYMASPAGTATSPPPPEPEPPPLPELPKPVEPEAVLPAATVDVGGEGRVDLHADDVASLDTLSLRISRAIVRVDGTLGEHVSARVRVDAFQPVAGGWSIEAREAWAEYSGGRALKQRVRAGRQEPIFGVRDFYEARYWVPGAHEDLGRQGGMVPAEDLALSWRLSRPDSWQADLQLSEGSIDTGKDVSGRVLVQPAGWLGLGVSGLYGMRGDGARAQGAASLEARGEAVRGLLEVAGGRTDEEGNDEAFVGAMLTVAGDLAGTGAVDHTTLLARGSGFDPAISELPEGRDYPDAWFAADAVVNVSWSTAPEVVLVTGLAYRLGYPQNVELPITHALTAQVAWSF